MPVWTVSFEWFWLCCRFLQYLRFQLSACAAHALIIIVSSKSETKLKRDDFCLHLRLHLRRFVRALRSSLHSVQLDNCCCRRTITKGSCIPRNYPNQRPPDSQSVSQPLQWITVLLLLLASVDASTSFAHVKKATRRFNIFSIDYSWPQPNFRSLQVHCRKITRFLHGYRHFVFSCIQQNMMHSFTWFCRNQNKLQQLIDWWIFNWHALVQVQSHTFLSCF